MESSVLSVGVRFALVLALASPLGACGGWARDHCEQRAACQGGNEADIDACVVGIDAAEEVADAYDCGEAYSKYVDCVAASAFCDSGKFKNGCGELDDALDACIDAASVKR